MNDFNQIYKIMVEAFPESERRDYEGQKKLLENDIYKIVSTYDNEEKRILAFIALWEFSDFIFLEHLAVSKEGRGEGIGSKILSDYIKSTNKKIFLEVEPITSPLSRRRVTFYERLGFKFNDFYYLQPPLRSECGYSELKIMSYPDKINQNKFIVYKQQIYHTIYKK